MIYFLLFILLIAITVLIFICSPQFGQIPSEKYKNRFSKSIQFNGKKFSNRHGITVKISFFKAMTLFPRMFKSDIEKRPVNKLPLIKINKNNFINFSDKLTRISWFGHSTVLIEIDGKRLMIDPMLGISSSPVSSFIKRFNNELPLNIKDLPPLDAVLITHDHFDHLDYRTIIELKEKVEHFYVPLGVGSHLIKWSVAENKITELDWWDELKFKDLLFACTPAQHFSGRSISGRNNTLWCSWVIKSKTENLFFSGDSGYFSGFKEIGDKYGPFALCMMECGQYNELWKEIHMMPEQTVQAQIDLKGKLLMPIHWGAFSLSMHKWNEPIERLSKYAQTKNVLVTTPVIGESVIVNEKFPNEKWWF